ncbi:MAG TPA: multifunctional oxoglutarate decarboxylase/oxoglutarate dehydrogenase thiamine pyrophosphate-binding subunit/dihydrolipoyllysine-residue succinyltransferase subunit [candidate division Zixibacteria bacterium]|nr:multifunctional oxoglutarate decarboxylase/oxoglutarate dehydrogenase thiamine pyrophosphate-binding subunit/dihydrolipoyllysine-residue succinyltransferase subunit [candidate division Zixibacteria bacterium]
MPSPEPPDPSTLAFALDSVNAGYVAEQYEQYRRDPDSVEPEWRVLFDSGFGGFEPVARPAAQPPEGNGSADGQRAAAAQAPAEPQGPAEPQPPGGGTVIRGPALRLAQNMARSLEIPTATSFRDVEVTTLEVRRRELNGRVAPTKVSFTHLIGWAIVRAATDQPSMTHYFTERDGMAYRVDPGGVNLGLAVDVERPDGSRFLVVPVIKGAEGMDFAQFHARYEDLVARARTNKLAPDDYAGATITLTNPGTLGTTASVPRLMPGQGTIVATGAIRDVGQRRVMTLTSTYDHRIIQGAESGAFLRRIDALLAGEDGFYEEVFAAMNAGAPRAIESAPMATTAPLVQPAAAPAEGQPGLEAVAAAVALVRAYRSFGHLAARLDPLGSEPPGDPALDPESLGLTPEAMAAIPARLLRVACPGDTLAEALPYLKATYCGSIAYEVEHLASHEERMWLREVIESGAHRKPLSNEERRALLDRLTRVEGLERFLHRAYLGQKRFSIEGLDAMVPMIDTVLTDAAAAGTRDVVIGMAHRGRLNVLAHVVGVSYEAILAEFEAGRSGGEAVQPRGESDDVKYHLGAAGTYRTPDDHEVRVTLSPNPSHLEAVDPVVEGRARAQQSDRSGREVTVDPDRTLPLLIHGDAAFAAQGVVAETLNLARLAGYTTGGTIHIIANNQVGFTTGAREARSTTYSSDLAKGFDVPIIHVNADDPEACLAAARLAMAYREKFHGDVVIDLVGYRRYGHNEGDEPAYTQPVMYRAIAEHPSVRELYQRQLVADGVVTEEEAETAARELARDLARRQAQVRRQHAAPELDRGSEALEVEGSPEPDTAVPLDRLRSLNAGLFRWPDGFTVHPKLVKQLERRRDALADAANQIDWAHAEALALASLLADGVPVRLTGQDTVRGTFSQRHATLFDARTGEPYTPMAHLDEARASFELHNSPLSEYGALGFEYGYAVTAPEALVLWEAQYGDFVNGAEIIIDQFIIAGLAKWRQTSRLTLLLPHGYEGAGPEHSSARLERFLALGAEGNIRVVYPTTPAQYFHLLRRQALHGDLRPLVVMTPKSLLRLPEAASPVSALTEGRFLPVIDDPAVAADEVAASVGHVILCSGKIYYDLLLNEERGARQDVAIVRVERLYPFPTDELSEVLSRYPRARRVSWVQEEPRNMGARKFVLPKIRQLVPFRIPLGDISRPERSRPAEGYPAAHTAEQDRIVREALSA